jgi:hypothetical protein
VSTKSGSARVVASRPPGPFAKWAEHYTKHGLCVMPVGTEGNPKGPAIKHWAKRKGPLAANTLADFIRRFGDRNIGMVCGAASGVVVVDLDDPSLLKMAQQRFGQTDILVRTPSGGWHLYYRYNGEKSRDLRKREKLQIEIKSDGTQVLMPPSLGANGEPYRWLGDFGVEGIERLQPMLCPEETDSEASPFLVTIKKGHRNKALFSIGMRLVKEAHSLERLLEMLGSENELLEEPLSEAELRSIAESCRRYEESGKNLVGTAGAEVVHREDRDRFEGNADALMLWLYLRFEHAPRDRRGEAFAVAPRAMQTHSVIPGWGIKRYRSALAANCRLGIIECIYRGGSGPHDPSLYRFCSKGAAREHNAIEHPPRGDERTAG